MTERHRERDRETEREKQRERDRERETEREKQRDKERHIKNIAHHVTDVLTIWPMKTPPPSIVSSASQKVIIGLSCCAFVAKSRAVSIGSALMGSIKEEIK